MILQLDNNKYETTWSQKHTVCWLDWHIVTRLKDINIQERIMTLNKWKTTTKVLNILVLLMEEGCHQLYTKGNHVLDPSNFTRDSDPMTGFLVCKCLLTVWLGPCYSYVGDVWVWWWFYGMMSEKIKWNWTPWYIKSSYMGFDNRCWLLAKLYW